MKLAFFFIWTNYPLVGSAGKTISTYYLSDVSVWKVCERQPPDYTVYRWLNTSSVSELKEVSNAEKMTAKVGMAGVWNAGTATLLVPEGDSERDISPPVIAFSRVE